MYIVEPFLFQTMISAHVFIRENHDRINMFSKIFRVVKIFIERKFHKDELINHVANNISFDLLEYDASVN